MNKCDDLIDKLSLIPHPEGGHFAETLRDTNGHVSHIYYLLKKNETSHWHKLNKNEILHFYDGDPLQIFLSKDKSTTYEVTLGRSLNKGQQFHFVVKAETWFCMSTLGEWSLIGCIVAPAFNYKDLKLAPSNWSPNKKK